MEGRAYQRSFMVRRFKGSNASIDLVLAILVAVA
jgi:hypothetical protein